MRSNITDKGGVAIQCAKSSQIGDQIVLRFTVKDTGIGIPPDIQGHLFNAFTQGDITTSRKYGGTGLGLVISKRLVELMGGQIGVESDAGNGSTFWFTIKVKEGKPAINADHPIAPLASLSCMRVLCIDDNEINCAIIREQVKSWNMVCDTAHSAREAMVLLEKSIRVGHPFDLILVDYVMPEMNGLDLVSNLRENPSFKSVPILMMTSLDMPLSASDLETIGVNMCMTKPIRQSALYNNIVMAMVNKDLPHQARHADSSPAVKIHRSRILLAEDNKINQQVAMSILRKLGYQVDVVFNGLEVMKSIQEIHYDLILMDCQMPEMDGYTTAQRIREREKDTQKHIIILALTAHTLNDDRKMCLDAGMDDYVPKPIASKTLAAALSKWLHDTD